MKPKIRRILLGVLLTTVMVIGLLPGMCLTALAEPDGVGISSLPSSAGAYYLTQDISIGSTWNVPSGTTTLDLNGYTISKTAGIHAISIGSGAKLILNDSGEDGTINGNNKNGCGVYINGGTLEMNGGTITKNSFEYGAGVYINSGRFTMNDGKISNNKAIHDTRGGGGAVYLPNSSAEFHMYGGALTENQANKGGAVYLANGAKFYLHNGSITNNKATNKAGGGVFAWGSNASFVMENGIISGNSAVSGGGVDISGGANSTLSGGIIEKNNASTAGGGLTNFHNGNTNSTIKISGSIVIRDNTQGGKANNLELRNCKVNIIGELSSDAAIGITVQPLGAFANCADTATLSDYINTFTSDDPNYEFGVGANGQLLIGSSVTVTYKVVNGTWSDDTTEDKAETVASGAMPASVPTGMKASEGYTGGAWDTDPAGAAITGEVTFTYTFEAKQAAAITTAPTANALTYNGQAQELVTAGEATGGEMQYALGTEAEATEPYSTTIPTATDAGAYHVWYKAVGDESHLDSEPARVEATIEPAASQDVATVLSANVTLSGDLVMNYYLSVPDDIASGATAVMEGPEDGKTLPEGGVRVALSSLSKDEKGRYEVSYPVTAVRADQPIAMRLEDAAGAAIELHNSKDVRLEGDVLTYGLYDYFGAALADDSPLDDAWKARIRATYTYCAYAVRWKYGTELPAGVNDLPDITAETADVVAHKATQEGTAPEGVAVTGVSLLLDSSTSLRLYFTCDGDVANHEILLDGKAVVPEHLSGNKYYVQVSSIGVKNLEKTFAVTFDGSYSVKLDALSYVSGALGDDSLGEPLKDAVRAFYAYDKAYKA